MAEDRAMKDLLATCQIQVAKTDAHLADLQHHIRKSLKALDGSRKLLKRPRDPFELVKLIGNIATGQTEDRTEDNRNQAATELGRKGGEARAASLCKKERAELAKKATAKRWSKR